MKPSSLLLFVALFGLFASCDNFFDTSSNRLMYEDDHKLVSPRDSVYSVLGILTKVQELGDRYVLLGELRGDLVQSNLLTDRELRELADFNLGNSNKYNNIKDYYEVINNCNYFINYADTTKQSLLRDYVAVKSLRAWTYLQLVLNYGEVEFYTQPLTEVADTYQDFPKYGIDQICQYFIDDLEPLKEYDLPDYGTIFGMPSSYFFYPINVLLGDLHLWLGNYEESAKAYYDYIYKSKLRITNYKLNYTDAFFRAYINAWSGLFQDIVPGEVITVVPMAKDRANGKTSQLADLFYSIDNSEQLSVSESFIKLAENQSYYYSESGVYTTGDLRLPGSLSGIWYSGMLLDTGSIRKHYKLSTTYTTIHLCRAPHVYLRFAEACNRAGYPSFAFAVLKYGLNFNNITNHVSQAEIAQNPPFFNFSAQEFDNNIALHARGSGDASENDKYNLVFLDSLQTADPIQRAVDSLAIIDSVEMLICDEYALETAFEGNRFHDLMRLSRHRNDPTFLAKKVAMRSATFNAELYAKLQFENNWYLPY